MRVDEIQKAAKEYADKSIDKEQIYDDIGLIKSAAVVDFMEGAEFMNKHRQQNNCIHGCKSYSGGEIKHHRDCPHYAESLSKLYDDLIEKIRWIPITERLPEIREKEYMIYAKNNRVDYDYAILIIDNPDSIAYLKMAFTHWKEVDFPNY